MFVGVLSIFCMYIEWVMFVGKCLGLIFCFCVCLLVVNAIFKIGMCLFKYFVKNSSNLFVSFQNPNKNRCWLRSRSKIGHVFHFNLKILSIPRQIQLYCICLGLSQARPTLYMNRYILEILYKLDILET